MEKLTIIIESDGVKHLHHDLEASRQREEMFKEAMMKAQSQADTMRRFIEDQEYQDQFAGFVLIARKHARRCDIYAEFGFKPEEEGATA